MNIVVLDGYTLNPGDLRWEGFDKFGNLQVYDRTPKDEIITRAKHAQIVLTNKTPLSKEDLKELTELKYIGVLATGYNVVDIDAANDQGVVVTNVPAYGSHSVAQMTFALLLELCQHVQRHSDSVKEGKWANSPDFCYTDYSLMELNGKNMGIIGFGDIGNKVADIATAFGMNILATNKIQTDQSHRKNFRWTQLPELLKEADVISIHCPLTSETEGLMNQESLKKMKNSAFLINTSRGPIVVEEDLADALNEGAISGAGLDVLNVEPPSHDNPLYKVENCLITPHIAWATKEARSRLMNIAVENLESFLNGKSLNTIKQ